MRASLIRTEPLSDSVTSFYFEPGQPIHYSAGQFARLTIPHVMPDSRGISREFTLSSSPSEPELAITVNFGGSRSSFKRALRQLEPGDEVSLDEPYGDFVMPLGRDIPLVWVAGGIGITPFRSQARYLADRREKREIQLFHSVHNGSFALFTDAFDAAGVSRAITDTRQTERLAAADIMRQTHSSDTAYFYLSGPEAMVDKLCADLRSAGVSDSRLITDRFLGY